MTATAATGVTTAHPAGTGVAGREAGSWLIVSALILVAAVAPVLPMTELKTDATILAGVLLSAGGYAWWRSGAMIARTVLDLPVLLLGAAAALSTLFSVDRFVSFFPSIRRGEGFVVFVVYLMMALAAARLNYQQVRVLIGAMVLAGTVIAAVAVPQFYGVDPTGWVGFVSHTQAQFYGFAEWGPAGQLFGLRSHATLGNPIFLGGYVVLLFPLAVVGALTAQRRWGFYGIAAVLLYAALIASQTRAAWIAAAVGSTLLIARLRAMRSLGRLAVLVSAMAVVTMVMTLTQPKVALSQRAVSSFRPADAPLQERIYLWRHTLPLVAGRPVLGWGFSTLLGRWPDLGSPEYVRVYGWHIVGIDTPHNELLHVAYSIGLVGLAAYLWVWASMMRSLYRPPEGGRMPYLSAALVAGLAGYFLWLQLAWNNIASAQVFWALAGVAVAAGRGAWQAADQTA